MLWLRVQSWLRCQEGQDLTEYALLLAFIAVVCILAVTALGVRIATFWQNAVSLMPGP